MLAPSLEASASRAASAAWRSWRLALRRKEVSSDRAGPSTGDRSGTWGGEGQGAGESGWGGRADGSALVAARPPAPCTASAARRPPRRPAHRC